MAFLQLIFTASKLNKLRNELVEEKQNAVKISKKEPTKAKFRHRTIRLRLKLHKLWKKVLSCFFFEKFCYTVRHDGSCENFTVKSIVGFVSGFILTYIFFLFFMFQLNFTLPTATIFCSILGCVLMIGLAFSTKVRCVVLLTLPQLFSQKGRQALLAYAFILAISGPCRNTLNNLGILGESLACGQEQLKQAVRQIVEVIKKPFLAIKEAIKKVVKTVKEVVKKIKEILLTIKRIIMAIVKVIKAAFEFLAKIINICNKELGTPFERCTRVFENAIVDCNAKLGPLFSWLCSLTYIVQSVCYLVKFLDLICMIVDFISDSVVGVVIRKVKNFVRHIRTMFYVRIRFSHSFQFQTNSSKSIRDVAHSMMGEIRQRTEVLRALFKFMTSAATLFFLFLIFKVTWYRFRFLTSERFDNKYINKDFREIDMRRAKLGKETVLPLNNREIQMYVTVSSKKLAKSERSALAKAASTLATASIKLGIYMAADYCLYWILGLIEYYGKFQSKVKAPNIPTVHVAGNGLLADLLKSIVAAFQPMGIELEIDTVPCLPTPIPPNYDRYVQIVTVLLLCWVLTLLEPYGLRLRHVVMCYYHPTRAKQRAIWLYNHIMRSRNSFLKFARRQLRRKVLGDGSIAKITCKEYLAANFKICRLCLGEGLQSCCLLCGEVFRETDDKKPVKCHTPDCPGIYCEQCFSDLQNLCTVCLAPIEYGDLSDISEEKDSSEEEPKTIAPKEAKGRKWRKWFICSKCCRKCFPEDEEDGGSKSKYKSWFGKKGDEDKDSTDEENKLLNDDTQPEKENDKTKDSDYYSSDNSTDYSYSYQYDKNKSSEQVPTVTSFKDVEKQDIPDYASMSSFREEEEDAELKSKIDEPTETIRKRSVGTIISGLTFDELKKERKVEFFGLRDKSSTTVRNKKKKRKRKRKMKEEQPLLEDCSCSCTCSDSDHNDKLKHLKSQVLPFFKSTSSSEIKKGHPQFISSSEDKGKSSSASVVGTETKSDVRHAQSLIPELDPSNIQEIHVPGDGDTYVSCGHEHVKIIVPELDLTLLTSTPRSSKNYIENFFGNVKYEEVSESPKSTSSSTRRSTPSYHSTPKDKQIPSTGKVKIDAEVSTTNDISTKTKVDIGTITQIKIDKETLTKVDPKIVTSTSISRIDQGDPITSKSKRDLAVSAAKDQASGKDGMDKYTSTAKVTMDATVSTRPVDKYKFEEKQRKKIKQYYKAVQGISCCRSVEGKKKGKFFNLVRRIIPKRKRNPDELPLYSRTNTEEVELKAWNYTKNQWDTPTSTSLDSALARQRSAIKSQYLSSSEDEGEGDRVRGGASGRIRNFRRSLHAIEETSFSRTDIATSRNSYSYPKPLTITREVLARYFVSIEDLTPTRDCDIPMTAIESPKPCGCGQNEALIRERPEKDTVLKENQETAVADTICTSGRLLDIQASSSSNLSESFCTSVLGVPCSIGDFSPATSRTSNFCCREVELARESLAIIPEETKRDKRQKESKEDHRRPQNMPKKKDVACLSQYCDCVNKDGGTQTCPASILKQCPLRESTTTIKSTADYRQPGNNYLEKNGIDIEGMKEAGATTTRTVETTERFPVKDSSTNPRTALTSDKIQQTSNNSIFNISNNPAFQGSSETMSFSNSSSHSCDCQCKEKQHSQCSYGCCKCPPPPPPRFDDYVDMKGADYGAGPRKSCPGYIEYPTYLPDSPSDYSMHAGQRPRYPRRYYMDMPIDSGYSLRESQYRDPADNYVSEKTRFRPDRAKSKQKQGNIIICACSGDCKCCLKKRQSVPPQYRRFSCRSSSSSAPEDDEEDEEDYCRDQHPNRHDLPYQNNDDYLDLVQELEETLQSRNRNRVRRAMQEFERRSKYNKPLEKPIIDYDQTSESEEPIIQRISQLTSEKKRCCAGDMCKCRRASRPQEKRSQSVSRGGGKAASGRRPQITPDERGQTKWQMDMNSGEWFKVSGSPQRYTGRRGSKNPSPRRNCPHDCSCCSSKNYNYR